VGEGIASPYIPRLMVAFKAAVPYQQSINQQEACPTFTFSNPREKIQIITISLSNLLFQAGLS
jgi:hypothetical protein